MSIHTPLCDLLGIKHRVLLAPIAGVSGGALAAAVSKAAGSGLIGGGCDAADWLNREFDAAGGARIRHLRFLSSFCGIMTPCKSANISRLAKDRD